MNTEQKVTLYFHSDVAVPGCDCGDREWEVQLPGGWMWSGHRGPGPFFTLADAMNYAMTLCPNNPDAARAEGPDLWVLSERPVCNRIGVKL